MTRADNFILDDGDRFPDMELSLTDDNIISLSDYTKNHWSIILIYRGDW